MGTRALGMSPTACKGLARTQMLTFCSTQFPHSFICFLLIRGIIGEKRGSTVSCFWLFFLLLSDPPLPCSPASVAPSLLFPLLPFLPLAGPSSQALPQQPLNSSVIKWSMPISSEVGEAVRAREGTPDATQFGVEGCPCREGRG